MEQFRFLNWKIYTDAQVLFSEILSLTKSLPQSYRFSLGDQAVRSSLSVILNIAEGSGKHSSRELNRYLDVALGSLYETAACVDTLNRNHFISEEQKASCTDLIELICRQIGGFRKKLSGS